MASDPELVERLSEAVSTLREIEHAVHEDRAALGILRSMAETPVGSRSLLELALSFTSRELDRDEMYIVNSLMHPRPTQRAQS